MSRGNWNANQAQVLWKLELNSSPSFRCKSLEDYAAAMVFPVTRLALRTRQLRIDFLICVIQYVLWELERKSNTSAVEARIEQ